MAGERLARILARVVAAGGTAEAPGPLCEVAAELIGVAGAGVMVVADDAPQVSLCAAGTVSALIEELQYTLGEGPCVDAHQTGKVVTEPNLLSPSTHRWPGFTSKVLDAGARALFSFPIQIGAARIGALDLHREEPGSLSDDQYADALVMADVIARALLALQADAPPGSLSPWLESELHTAVHQAAGMTSVQLGIRVGEALVLLRAYAFRTDRHIDEVARDVVARRLCLDSPGAR